MNSSEIHEQAERASPANKKLLQRLKREKSNKLDAVVHQLHEEVFTVTDCLKCANCCKTTSPIFYQRDIERLSKKLQLKPSQFVEKYLKLDEDGDYVLQKAPCAFLDSENYCTVYEDRPAACREYPHTDRKRFYQLLDLSYRNTFVCPAVYEIFEQLRKLV